ncbi:GYD domain-containing protein, partial [Streptomyces sp. NPDC058622]|uniref:GYD domain-containing protein n=1 Tax=Streptomyces sp. NPDC058622 TaxID=3346562 RepID=UPI00364622B0
LAERKGDLMPLYLSRFSYTPGTWARLIVHPEDRAKAAQAYIESVGGKLHGFWYAFGRHDGYNLWEAPTTCPWPRLRWRLVEAARLARSRRQFS